MSSAAAKMPPAYRRRLLYVDSSVQRSLLLAMVALEVILVAAAIGFAYWRLIELIDASMYRMNFAQTGSSLAQFAQEGFWVLGLFAVINVFALMIASGIWSHHENLVLKDFANLIEKSRALDFCSDADALPQHEVLALALAWRARERARFTAIRDQLTQLEAALSQNLPHGNLRALTDDLNKLLPPAGAHP